MEAADFVLRSAVATFAPLALPSPPPIPPATTTVAPASLLCDRIEDWHQQNPGNTTAQLFYGIAAKSPGSAATTTQKTHAPSQQQSSRHPVTPHRIHPHTSSKAPLLAQKKDAPPHLMQHSNHEEKRRPTSSPGALQCRDIGHRTSTYRYRGHKGSTSCRHSHRALVGGPHHPHSKRAACTGAQRLGTSCQHN